MKWMLVVLVFGSTPMETGVVYDSLDECLKVEESMRAEWERATKAMQQEYRAMPTSPDYIAKQSVSGTCIPHGHRVK